LAIPATDIPTNKHDAEIMLRFAHNSVVAFQSELKMSKTVYDYLLSAAEEEAEHGRQVLAALERVQETSQHIYKVVEASGLLKESSIPRAKTPTAPEPSKL